MSSRITTTTNNTATLRRFPDGTMRSADSKFCKVCFDAGLPVTEYTDHFVKDQPGPNGNVICRTLLHQACRICQRTGHTSSYCPQYRRREEPRREEPRREEPRRGSFNQLREDTERRDRELSERDDSYYREQEKQRHHDSTPWLQAVKQQPRPQQHRVPYAHPHGPRVRLNLEARALSAAKHGDAAESQVIVVRGHQQPLVIPGAIDVLAVNLSHSEQWGDEEIGTEFNPDEMCEEFLRNM